MPIDLSVEARKGRLNSYPLLPTNQFIVRYIDSGNELESQTVGAWIASIIDDVAELRWQTGYFDADSIGLFLPILPRVPVAHLVIGANPNSTSGTDIERLANALGLPRSGVRLVLVTCADALFHPKVLHVLRQDGSACAFVGSANVTFAGMTGKNVEAGVILDTRDGDSSEVLSLISMRIDAWLSKNVVPVPDRTAVLSLVSSGVLVARRQDRQTSTAEPSEDSPGQRTSRPKIPRRPLFSLPRVPHSPTVTMTPTPVVSKLSGGAPVLIAEIPGASTRWKQANFHKITFINFFGADPQHSRKFTFHRLNPDGSKAGTETRPSGSRKSKNYSFELEAASGLSYPVGNERPIGVFLRVATREFRYMLMMPGKPGYTHVANVLGLLRPLTRTGRGRPMRDVIVDEYALLALWPRCPLLP